VRVLDLGAGGANTAREFFPDAEVVSVDFDPAAGADVLADVRELPADLGEFDVVLASHVLEHLSQHEAVETIEHWLGFVKEGGRLQILVPDLMWAAEQLVSMNGMVHPAVLGHLFGGQQTEGRCHRCGYTVKLLRDLLRARGLWIEALETAPFVIVMGSGEQVRSRQVVCVARKPSPRAPGGALAESAGADSAGEP
jgi:trans-aconitate methyltransferase